MAQNTQQNKSNAAEEKTFARELSEEDFMVPYSTDAEAERPLSPGLVARVTEVKTKKAAASPEEEQDPNSERVVRETERSRINESPSRVWPG